jgi:predicted transcriptional regulator
MRQFGELEAVIMDRLWEWGRPALVREVVDDLHRDRPLAYTTVMTVMENLYRKGWLRRERDGRAWRYEPTRSRSAYTAALMNDALGTSTDRRTALAHFVLQMSPHDVTLLQQALDQAHGETRDQTGGQARSRPEGAPTRSRPEGGPARSRPEGGPARSHPEGAPTRSHPEGAPTRSHPEEGGSR